MKKNRLSVKDRTLGKVKRFSKPNQLLSWYSDGLGRNNKVSRFEGMCQGLACGGRKFRRSGEEENVVIVVEVENAFV